MIKDFEVKLWLGDYRLARVVRLEDQEWAAKVWFPKFLPVAISIEKMARVQSDDVFSQLSTSSIKDKIGIQGLPF